MKIAFWFDYDQTYTFTKIFNEMYRTNSNLEATGFVVNNRYYEYAKNNLVKYSKLYKFYDLLEKFRYKKPDKEKIEKFLYYDNKYFLSKIMYSDRHLNKLTYDEVKNIFVNFISFFEEVIKKEKIEVFVFNCIASSYSHLFYIVLKENGVKVIIPNAIALENRIALANNPYQQFAQMYEYFNKLNNNEITADDVLIKQAKKTINKIRDYKPAYEDKNVHLQKDKFKIPPFKRIYNYFYNYFKYYKNDYTQPSMSEKVLKIFKLRYNLKKSFQFFDEFSDIKAPFIYFPLHFEPEIATLVLSQYDQLAIIDIIVKQMPLNWKLVIKEHPAMIGQRDYKFYETIKNRYPNVVIVEPSTNSQKLIYKSEIVFSLCGTVIFESIVLKKPVIYTGRVRYEGFGLGIHSKDILNFDKLIKEALNYQYDDKKIENMIISMLKYSYDFIFAEPLGVPETLNKENIKKIANAFIKQISKK